MKVKKLKLMFNPGRNNLVRIMTETEKEALKIFLDGEGFSIGEAGDIFYAKTKRFLFWKFSPPKNSIAYIQQNGSGSYSLYTRDLGDRSIRKYHKLIRRISDSVQ
jgi:hypothetical protein